MINPLSLRQWFIHSENSWSIRICLFIHPLRHPPHLESCWYWPDCFDWIQDASYTLQWRHNERDGVSNHRHLDCLLNRLFRGESTGDKGPVTWTMFPFDDVVMNALCCNRNVHACVYFCHKMAHCGVNCEVFASWLLGVAFELSLRPWDSKHRRCLDQQASS